MFNKLKKLIDENSTISFDIFDTLLLRNISRPTDIFRTMNDEVLQKYKISNFSNLRVEAEQNARKKSVDMEVTLDDIYNSFSIKNPNLDKIKEMELDREIEFIVENPFMKKIYNYAEKNKKKIYYISDMYLSSSFIKKLLEKNGYKVNNNIYVSCECHAVKGNGSLFKYVEEKEKIDKNSWLHIGDNTESDYNSPIREGLSAFNYKNVNSYRENNSKSVFESIILGMINNKIYNGLDIEYWDNFGYKYLTPIYLGFTNFVYLMSYKSDNIFFLARDGYIVEKIYNLFPNIKDKYIDYLYVSRNSIQIPEMYFRDRDGLLELLSKSNSDLKLRSYFKKCMIEPKEEYLKIINLYGFKNFDDLVTDENRYNAEKCMAYFFDISIEEMKKNKELAKEYLHQEKIDQFETPFIVDIGWGGSIQDSIRKLINKNVRGLYLGTIDLGKKDYLSQTYGFIFDQDNPKKMKERILEQVSMFELIFSAPHGTTIKYKKENNIIIPLLAEKDNFSDIVEKFQNASLELIKSIIRYYKYYDRIDSSFCISFYNKYLDNYSFKDMMEFKKLEIDCELGSNRKYPFIQIVSKEDINNQDKFEELEKRFKRSLWKDSYLIENVSDEKDFIKESASFEIYKKEKQLKKKLDFPYDTIGNYINVAKEIINSKYIDYLMPEINKYYHKYHPTFFQKLRRKIIPYKLRKYIINRKEIKHD